MDGGLKQKGKARGGMSTDRILTTRLGEVRDACVAKQVEEGAAAVSERLWRAA